MRNLGELNLQENGEPVDRPEPTSPQVSFIEELVGRVLPQSYLQFLKYSNGGQPEQDTFYFTYNDEQQEWAVDTFFHISSDTGSFNNVVWEYRNRWNDAPRSFLPIAADGSGNLICLDLSEPGSSKVVLWVHDDPELPLLPVADSFEEFIDSLTINPDYI